MASDSSLHQTSRALIVFLILFFAVSALFLVRFFWKTTDPEKNIEQAKNSIDISDIRFLEARTLKTRENAGEILIFLDIRLREAFDTHHILGSTWVAPDLLIESAATTGTIILVIDETISASVLHSIKNEFDRHNRQFAVLTDGISGWQTAGGRVISVGDPYSFVDQSKISFITPEKAKDFLTDQVFILDVQNALAYDQAHIPKAINIPLSELEQRRTELPFTQSIVVYGTNDLEGFQAGVRLFDMNVLGVRTLDGGLAAWKAANLPIETKKP